MLPLLLKEHQIGTRRFNALLRRSIQACYLMLWTNDKVYRLVWWDDLGINQVILRIPRKSNHFWIVRLCSKQELTLNFYLLIFWYFSWIVFSISFTTLNVLLVVVDHYTIANNNPPKKNCFLYYHHHYNKTMYIWRFITSQHGRTSVMTWCDSQRPCHVHLYILWW